MTKTVKKERAICYCGNPSKAPKQIYCSIVCANKRTGEAKLAKFEENIKSLMGMSDDPDKCWIWLGTIEAGGYGVYSHKGKVHKAHRLTYQMFNGPIPDGHMVRHTCDVRNCVNPNHLITGTAKQNTGDIVERKRYGRMMIYKRGEKNPMAVLTMKQVILIRKLFNPKIEEFSLKGLAKTFNVGVGVIRQAIKNKTYIDPNYNNPFLTNRKLTIEQVKEIKDLYRQDKKKYSSHYLGLLFGLSSRGIRSILAGRTYKE